MARLFDNASSEYLRVFSGLLSAEPISMACGFNSDDVGSNQTLMALGNTGASTGFYRIAAMGGVGGDPLRVQKQDDAGAGALANSSTGFSVNTDHYAVGVFKSDISRTIYIDGGSKITNTTSVADPTPDTTNLGVLQNSGLLQFMSGLIWEAGLWNLELTDADALLLSLGVSPLLVRPEGLVAYWPLIGRTSPEIDVVGGNDMTLVNSPAVANQPFAIYPRSSRVLGKAAAVAAVDIPSLITAPYRAA